MNCEQVLATLRAHEPTLKAVGVVHLSLFGSTARGDRRPIPTLTCCRFDRTAAYASGCGGHRDSTLGIARATVI